MDILPHGRFANCPIDSISISLIIAVSANAFDEDMEASYEAGMNGHLEKPIIESELLKTLGEIWFDNFFMID